MTAAILLATLLVVGTSLLHLMVFRALTRGMRRVSLHPYAQILLILLAILAAHMVAVILYAVAYALSVQTLQIGNFSGVPMNVPLDYLYFSIVSYTSLGLGDVFPNGHLRLITGVEALNGLLLIAWSGSFIFIAMGRIWPWESVSPARQGRVSEKPAVEKPEY